MAEIKTGCGTIKIRKKQCNCGDKKSVLPWSEFYHGMRLIFMLMLGAFLILGFGTFLVYLAKQLMSMV